MKKSDMAFHKNAGLVPEAQYHAKLRKDLTPGEFVAVADKIIEGKKRRRYRAKVAKEQGY